MKNCFSILLLLSSFGLQGQTKGALLDRFDRKQSSEHFVFQWNQGQTSEQEIEGAIGFAEEVISRLSTLLGKERMPENKLILTFGGEGVDKETRKKRTPHVDYQGRVHLYRFDGEGYLGPLPHELVHAIRVGTLARWDSFFEEGLASAISYYLYPERKGFPRFGYSLDLVAGYWLVSERGIPFRTMRDQHNRLNLKCQLQTYVTREDFFNYLLVHYGIEKLVDQAYADHPDGATSYSAFYTKTFDQLIKDWETDLRQRYEVYQDAEQQISEYFEKTSARYIPVCERGVDYN